MLQRFGSDTVNVNDAIQPQFMTLNQFLTDNKIKKHTDPEEYNKMKLEALHQLVKNKMSVKGKE
jgi:hypothetical protein